MLTYNHTTEYVVGPDGRVKREEGTPELTWITLWCEGEFDSEYSVIENGWPEDGDDQELTLRALDLVKPAVEARAPMLRLEEER